jgi:hypothetical protein
MGRLPNPFSFHPIMAFLFFFGDGHPVTATAAAAAALFSLLLLFFLLFFCIFHFTLVRQ